MPTLMVALLIEALPSEHDYDYEYEHKGSMIYAMT
jgi:hypothetical protein